MEHIRHRRPSRELAVDPDIIRFEDVGDTGLARDRLSSLVDACGRGVGMTIDDSRRNMFAGRIDDERILLSFDVLADLNNLPLDDQHISVVDLPRGTLRPDRCIPDEHRTQLLGESRASELSRREHIGEGGHLGTLRAGRVRRRLSRPGPRGTPGVPCSIGRLSDAKHRVNGHRAGKTEASLCEHGICGDRKRNAPGAGGHRHGRDRSTLILDRTGRLVHLSGERQCGRGGRGTRPKRELPLAAQIDLWKGRPGIALPIDPDVSHAGAFGEQVAVRNDDVRRLSLFE